MKVLNKHYGIVLFFLLLLIISISKSRKISENKITSTNIQINEEKDNKGVHHTLNRNHRNTRLHHKGKKVRRKPGRAAAFFKAAGDKIKEVGKKIEKGVTKIENGVTKIEKAAGGIVKNIGEAAVKFVKKIVLSIKEVLGKLKFKIPKKILKNPSAKLYLQYLGGYSNKISKLNNVEEFKKRFNTLEQISLKINSLNLKDKKFKCGINKFSDQKVSEVVKTHTGLDILDFSKLPREKLKPIDKAFLETNFKDNENIKLWEPIDWVKQGKVSSVDNQQSCGACWAFAFAGMAESHRAIRTNKPVETISRQYILDCIQEKTGNPGSCAGGHFIYAGMWAKTTAFPLESEYSYQAIKKEKCPIIATPVSGFFADFNVHQEVTPEYLYRMLSKGPVAINIDSAAQEFISYTGGVLKYKNSSPAPNHAVLLVGFGKETDGTEYWLIKNQWGNDWGEKGYAKIEKTAGQSFIYTNLIEFI